MMSALYNQQPQLYPPQHPISQQHDPLFGSAPPHYVRLPMNMVRHAMTDTIPGEYPRGVLVFVLVVSLSMILLIILIVTGVFPTVPAGIGTSIDTLITIVPFLCGLAYCTNIARLCVSFELTVDRAARTIVTREKRLLTHCWPTERVVRFEHLCGTVSPHGIAGVGATDRENSTNLTRVEVYVEVTNHPPLLVGRPLLGHLEYERATWVTYLQSLR